VKLNVSQESPEPKWQTKYTVQKYNNKVNELFKHLQKY